MNTIRIGSEYGGWTVDLDSISDGDFIICGGVGEDITFETGLLKLKKVNPILVDPTPKSHSYIENNFGNSLVMIKKAIAKRGTESVRLYRNSNPNHVSESVIPGHLSVSDSFYDADCVSVSELIEQYNPSLIKIDIEGSEYSVLSECIGVKQICVEFHHHCIEGVSINSTLSMVKLMEDSGYKIIDNHRGLYQEMTFLKEA